MRATDGYSAPCFRWKNGHLHAAEIVGCIQIGDLRINILPKLDSAEDERDRNFLINIMSAAGYLSRPLIRPAEVRSSFSDPLEVLISEVASEMDSGLREGIPRRYEEKREELPTVRGRIDLSKLSARLPSDRFLLPVRYSPLSINNHLARCIKGIATLLLDVTRNSISRQIFRDVILRLSNVDSRPLVQSDLESLSLKASESHWSRLIDIARLLFKGQTPDPTFSGRTRAFSMLFPLQHLFERSMRKILAEALKDSHIFVSHRSTSRFLLKDPSDGSGVVRLRPDYILTGSEGPLAVADAKWKRAKESNASYGVVPEDLYQVYVYLARFGVPHAFVFMPKANWMHDSWRKSFDIPEEHAHIHLVGVDIQKLVARNGIVRSQAHADLSATIRELFLT
jgi:5-methylcytosine-specific restriction endonuclease McrBC regulatory subunit McrC